MSFPTNPALRAKFIRMLEIINRQNCNAQVAGSLFLAQLPTPPPMPEDPFARVVGLERQPFPDDP